MDQVVTPREIGRLLHFIRSAEIMKYTGLSYSTIGKFKEAYRKNLKCDFRYKTVLALSGFLLRRCDKQWILGALLEPMESILPLASISSFLKNNGYRDIVKATGLSIQALSKFHDPDANFNYSFVLKVSNYIIKNL